MFWKQICVSILWAIWFSSKTVHWLNNWFLIDWWIFKQVKGHRVISDQKDTTSHRVRTWARSIIRMVGCNQSQNNYFYRIIWTSTLVTLILSSACESGHARARDFLAKMRTRHMRREKKKQLAESMKSILTHSWRRTSRFPVIHRIWIHVSINES